MDYLDEFFSNPKAFAAHFVEDIERNDASMRPLVDRGFLPLFMDQLTRSLSDKLAELHPKRPNDLLEQIMLTFIVSGFLAITARFAESHRETVIAASGHFLSGIREYNEHHFDPLLETKS